MNTLLPVFPFRDLLCAGCCEELQDGVASGEAMIRIQMTQLHTWHKSYKKCLLFVDRTCYAAKTKLELLATLFEVNQALCHRYLVCGKRIAGPDYNPTELTFSSVKSYLKNHIRNVMHGYIIAGNLLICHVFIKIVLPKYQVDMYSLDICRVSVHNNITTKANQVS